jgi:eukaryotic-like serine/threonine-protein kinase
MAVKFCDHPPIPGYEPVRLLGKGTTGPVYVAWSARAGREIVLRVWHREFRQLAYESIVVGVEHPNVLGVFDVGEVEGHAYVAIEHL